MYEGLLAETVHIQGHNGDQINGYLARPLGGGPYPSVVVIHHMPGWDAGSKEITRHFATNGYVAVCPNLHYRENPDNPPEATNAARAAGGVPDDRCIGDVRGAVDHLRALPYANGKVGVIGYCSGGRQVYIVACNLRDLDAAVDCYGGRVIQGPDELTDRMPVAPIDMTPDLGCPLLGLFGAEDSNPSPEHVARMDQELKRHGKTYEFHTYENAGHAFFAVDRTAYRTEAAMDGWQRVFAWFGKYLAA